MDPQDLIKMLQNRMTYNQQQRELAFARGDVDLVRFYDADSSKTQSTLDTLQSNEPLSSNDLNNIRLAFR